MSQQQTNIHLIVPVRFLFDHCLWDRVCDALGWDVYSVSEGRMSSDDLVTLDVTKNMELCRVICEAATGR